jgi:hypothetical protein
MGREMRLPALAGLVGLMLLALGVIYLSVECQALPGFMGPVHGDAAPRTGLGIVGVVLGMAVLAFTGLAVARRRHV